MLASLQKYKGRLEYALQKTLRLKIFSDTVHSQNLVRAVGPLHKNMWPTYPTKEWDLRSLTSFKPISQKGKPRLCEMSSPGCTNMYGQKCNWVFKIFKSRAMWPGNGSKRYHDLNHIDSLSQTAFNQLSLFCLFKECYGWVGGHWWWSSNTEELPSKWGTQFNPHLHRVRVRELQRRAGFTLPIWKRWWRWFWELSRALAHILGVLCKYGVALIK